MFSKRRRYAAAAAASSGECSDDDEERAGRPASSDGDDPCSDGEPEGGAGADAAGDQQQLALALPRPAAIKGLQLGKGGASGLVCHVCGQRGHRAGFVGPVYMDCPNKPCYLCKQPGHTTLTCPHRAGMPGAGGGAAHGGGGGPGPAQLLLARERSGRQPREVLPPRSPAWQVEAAILRLHSRRVCCLAFPAASDSVVLSGDKKGGIAAWNFRQVHERTLHTGIHTALVNALRPAPWLPGGLDCASASSDGTVKLFDCETGSVSQQLVDLNPGGWHEGCAWRMFYGLDANEELGILLAGDSLGQVHTLDPRAAAPVAVMQLHKPGSKVNAVSVNPAGGARVVLTGSNDHTAKLFDLRKLSSAPPPPAASSPPPPSAPPADGQTAAAACGGSRGRGRGRGRARGRGSSGPASTAAAQPEEVPALAAAAGAAAAAAASGASGGRGRGQGRSRQAPALAAAAAATAAAELACMPHGRVVNGACFSPSGRKILTTCQDNRLRVWGNLAGCGRQPPDSEIIHSHDFNRYLTPFRAEWMPGDPAEASFICGRYISQELGGVALHPVDILDTCGRLLAALADRHLTTISPVNLPHPRLDLIISGSSRSLYKWAPAPDWGEEAELAAAGGAHAAAAAAAGAMRSSVSAAASFVCVDADPGGAAGSGKQARAQKRSSVAAQSKTPTAAAAAAGSSQAKQQRKSKKRRQAAADSSDNPGEAGGDGAGSE